MHEQECGTTWVTGSIPSPGTVALVWFRYRCPRNETTVVEEIDTRELAVAPRNLLVLCQEAYIIDHDVPVRGIGNATRR